MKVTVKKVNDPDPKGYKWAICLNGKPTWYRSSKEMAMKHAAQIKKDIQDLVKRK